MAMKELLVSLLAPIARRPVTDWPDLKSHSLTRHDWLYRIMSGLQVLRTVLLALAILVAVGDIVFELLKLFEGYRLPFGLRISEPSPEPPRWLETQFLLANLIILITVLPELY